MRRLHERLSRDEHVAATTLQTVGAKGYDGITGNKAAVLFNMFTTQRTEALVGVGFICVGAGVYFALRLDRQRGPVVARQPDSPPNG